MNACVRPRKRRVGAGPHVGTRLAAVALTLLFLLQVNAASALAVFADDCDSGNFAATQTIITRPDIGDAAVVHYYGVIANVWARTLRGCTNPTNSVPPGLWGADFDLPGVLPVNLQYRQVGWPTRLVQMGYTYCNRPASQPKCYFRRDDLRYFIPNDGKYHFFHVIDDDPPTTADRNFTTTAGWYKTSSGAEKTPIVGHLYRLKIESVVLSGVSNPHRWRLCIRDVTAGEVYTCTTSALLKTWTDSGGNPVNSGRFAWWGTENTNTNTQNGTAITEAHLSMHDMEYEAESQDNWVIITGQASHDPDCYKLGELYPTYYDCSIASTNFTGDTLRSFTRDH